jgi:hypothetical protein
MEVKVKHWYSYSSVMCCQIIEITEKTVIYDVYKLPFNKKHPIRSSRRRTPNCFNDWTFDVYKNKIYSTPLYKVLNS